MIGSPVLNNKREVFPVIKEDHMDSGAKNYRRFLDGDNDAFTDLVREFWDGLALYLSKFVESFAVAEEIAEEAFIKIYVDKPKFSGKSSFKTWLYAIGRYTANHYIRKKSNLSEPSIDDFYDISDGEDIEKRHIRSDEKRIIHQAMDKLNDDYKRVLYLIYFEGFSTSETAEIMKKTERQIYNLVFRSKEKLRKILIEEGFEYEDI